MGERRDDDEERNVVEGGTDVKDGSSSDFDRCDDGVLEDEGRSPHLMMMMNDMGMGDSLDVVKAKEVSE